MFRSELIPTIQSGKQLAAVKMAIAYNYSNIGPHTSAGSTTTKAVKVLFYGLRVGIKTLIGTAYLENTSGAAALEPCSCIIMGIPCLGFPYIQWEIDLNTSTTFGTILGDPQILFSVTGGTDFLDSEVVSVATTTEST